MLNDPVGGYSASFPADLRAGAGYRIEKTGLTARIVADYTNVPLLTAATDAGQVLVQNPATGLMYRLDLGDLPSGTPANGAVTNPMLAESPALTVKGNATNVSATAQDIPLASLAQPGNPVGDAIVSAVGYPADIVDTFARSLDDKARERPKSFLDFMPTSVRNNYRAGGIVDLTPYLQKALDSGRDLFMPPNLPAARITGALEQKAPRQVVRWSPSTTLFYAKPFGTPSTAMWVIRESAVHAELHGLNADHNSQGANYLKPTNNIAYGSTVIAMADYSLISNCLVGNAWDNGIAVGQFNITEAGQSNGRPIGASVQRCRTYNCGIGYHHDGGQAGAGVNVLLGSRTMVSDCVDFGSITGFAVDFAAGAGGMLVGCRSLFAKTSETPDVLPNGTVIPANQLGGFGFYVGASHLSMISCTVDEAARRGFWLDGFSHSVHMSACRAKGCREEGILLQGDYNTLIDFTSEQNSYQRPGQFAGIRVRAVAVNEPSQHSRGITIVNPMTYGTDHSYGLKVEGGDAGQIVMGNLHGGYLNGTVKPLDISAGQIFTATGYSQPDTNVAFSAGAHIFEKKCQSFAAQPFGDFQGNGAVLIRDPDDPRKQISTGFDPVNDLAVVQAIQSTVGTKPYWINPSGGSVYIGKASPSQNDASSLLYVPLMGGAPTGTPPNVPGMAPIVVDGANARLYVNFGGTWKYVALG